MRRWIALLIGPAAIAVAGTAMALDGSWDTDAKETTTTTVEEKVYESIRFEPLPKGMLNDDVLPEKKRVEKEPVEKEPVEKKPVEKEPVDDTPPHIEILHPVEGQVYETKEVVLEGVTEPGARVFAGKWEADVSDEGAWRIVLFLEKGKNHITLKAIDEAGNIGKDSVTVIYEPKKEEPKEEEPKEEPAEWHFKARQLYGQCGENPPYDVFYGHGKPGSAVHIESEFGGGSVEVNEKGEWEKKVIFEGAPAGEAFAVHVADEFGNHKVFEFVHKTKDH